MLIDLFITFFLIGLVSFGGGYAMIPLIQEEVVGRHGWMTAQQLTEAVSVAGMAPGPIATNVAIFIGYRESGLLGATVASLAMVLPSFIIIIAIGMLFMRIRQHKLVRSSFYGLRAIVTGLIIYAAIVFAMSSGMIGQLSWFMWSQIFIFLGSLGALLFYRKHPFKIMILSGLIGIALYG